MATQMGIGPMPDKPEFPSSDELPPTIPPSVDPPGRDVVRERLVARATAALVEQAGLGEGTAREHAVIVTDAMFGPVR